MLQSKNAIITGAKGGIGKKTVEVFASFGANIWACDYGKDDAYEQELQEISTKYNVKIWPIYFDITNESEIKATVQEIRKQKITVDILVNMAGLAATSTSFAMTSIDKMKRVFDVNFYGATILTQYISRLMIRQNKGNIINVASIAGLDGTPAQYEYAASKAAMIGGTKNLARELAQYNIRVNAVAPGMIETEMGAKIEENLKQEMLNKVIMKRMGKPEEIANVIAFLASDLSSFMTAQVIRVDGGI